MPNDSQPAPTQPPQPVLQESLSSTTPMQTKKTIYPLIIVLLILLFGIGGTVGYYLATKSTLEKKGLNITPGHSPTPTAHVVSEQFTSSMNKIDNDLKNYPHSIYSPLKANFRKDDLKVIDVVWVTTHFADELVNDLTFRSWLDAYVNRYPKVQGYWTDVYEIYGIKCTIEKSGKDPSNYNNLVSIELNCFEEI